jgi:hypothetical protein
VVLSNVNTLVVLVDVVEEGLVMKMNEGRREGTRDGVKRGGEEEGDCAREAEWTIYQSQCGRK